MGLGISEPYLSEERLVPGTIYLYDSSDRGASGLGFGYNLKRSQEEDLILSPQPTASPNDPLNWPTWKKHMCLFTVAFINGFNEAVGILFSPITAILAEQFHVDFNKAAQLQGINLLTLGFGGIIFIPFSRWFGKRPTFLVGILILFATTVWIIYANSYSSLLAARGVFGFGNSAFNAMSVAIIGDMYFVHERGTKVQFLYFLNVGSLATAPILGGYIAYEHGWRLLIKICAGLYGACILLVIFFCPETTYIRPAMYETDIASEKHFVFEPNSNDRSPKTDITSNAVPVASDSPLEDPPISFLRQLAPFHGIFYRENPIQLILRPIVCMLFPAVLVSALSVAVYGCWAVGTSVTLAQVFSVPPASFNAAQLGYTSTFAAVGSIAAFFIGAFLLDPISKWAARRNNGILEPEFRFFLNVVMYTVGIPGFFALGYYASGPHPQWVVASFIIGLIFFGLVLSSTISYAYILDCHRNYASEMTVALTMIRSALAYAGTSFLPDWFETSGTKTTYYCIGGIEIGIFLLSALTYVYGKCLREFTHRYNLIKLLRI